MKESFPNPDQFEKDEKERKKKEYISLAEEMSKRERLPFPGIDSEAYATLKADDEKFPGYTTPIDELAERFEKEGMKVVFGSDKESGNVYVLPSGSNDIERDSLFPRHLKMGGDMDEILKKLIEAYKK